MSYPSHDPNPSPLDHPAYPAYPLQINYYQTIDSRRNQKITITTNQETGHLPEAICDYCNNETIYVKVAFFLPTKNFSLAGVQVKFSMRRKIYLFCAECESKTHAIEWP